MKAISSRKKSSYQEEAPSTSIDGGDAMTMEQVGSCLQGKEEHAVEKVQIESITQ